MSDLPQPLRVGARLPTSSCAGPRSPSARSASTARASTCSGSTTAPASSASTSPRTRRRTICISTQAGCPLKCAFCLTGIAGYKRNLTAVGDPRTGGRRDEHRRRTHPERREDAFPWNIVMMGMGEPLLNYDATLEALRVLMDEDGFARPAAQAHALDGRASCRRSRRLASEPRAPEPRRSACTPPTRPAARADADRGEVSPSTRSSTRRCATRSPRGGRVTFEYVLLGGVNDSARHARELARRLRRQARQGQPDPAQPRARDPVQAARDPRPSRRSARVLAEARRPRVRAPAARPGHPGGLRPAPPQAGRALRPPPP